ncbi:MAG: hypothetical protein KAS32_04335 [Candidatus Peribacteraceae bacterium]|nr:hypothetical protein [Candidatus Peribacteraceae bacterium]
MMKRLICIVVLLLPCVLFAQDSIGLRSAGAYTLYNGQWIGTSQAGGWTFTSDPYIYTTTASVGIGTTTPLNELDVRGAVSVDEYLRHNADTNTWVRFSEDRIRLGVGTLIALDAYEAATIDYIVLAPAGNMLAGVGTEDPDHAFHIVSATGPQFVITDTDKADSTTFEVDGNGDLTITPTGIDMFVNGAANFAADGQADDDYEISLSGITALHTGLMVVFTATTANTDGASLEITEVGDVDAILKLSDQALVTGDVEAGQVIVVVFDGTNWQMTSQLAQ